MKFLCLATALGAALVTLAAVAQPIPERRSFGLADTDLFGGDIRSIIGTSLPLCEKTCLDDTACASFTFNTRSNACFLKSGEVTPKPFKGALSARVVGTPADILKRGEANAAALKLPDGTFKAARDLALSIGTSYPSTGAAETDLVAEAAAAEQAGDLRGAMVLRLRGLNANNGASGWAEVARLAMAINSDDYDQKQNDLRMAANAALNSYLRGTEAPRQAAVLRLLATALEALGDGRASIDVLRRAEALAPDTATAAALSRAIGLYGFRVMETTADFQPASPRICVRFSESLVRSGVDYADFVRFEGGSHPVEVDADSLCLEGLEHGVTYRFDLREGLPANSGEVLDRTISQTVYVRDRAPSARFIGRNYVLPRAGAAAIPVITVNTDTVDLEINRVGPRGLASVLRDGLFGAQIDSSGENQLSQQLGETVWTGTGTVERKLNADVTTALPIGEAVKDLAPGLYAMTARIPKSSNDGAAATQWFVITDLGLATVTGADGLNVFVRALSSAKPREGVTLRLIARDNDILGEAQTDAEGHARFDPGLMRGPGGSAPGFVVAETEDHDLAFLNLADPAFDFSDRGVEGRDAPPPIDVFASTDRGAYRPGETMHATILTRDSRAEAVTGLALTAVVLRPDGVESSRQILPDGGAGGRVMALPIGADAQRGTWRVRLHADPEAPPLTTLSFLVEDFVPERIDFDLTMPEAPVSRAVAPDLSVDARYLYGAPGADLAIEGETRIEMTRSLSGFEGFLFGREDEPYRSAYAALPGGLTTDAEGKAVISLPLAPLEPVSQPLEMTATLRLSDGSGRPVERSLKRPLLSEGNLIGIKPLFDGSVDQGGTARFEVIAVDPDLRRIDLSGVEWVLFRVETNYQWYELDGNWNYEPITRREKVANGRIDVPAGAAAKIETPVDWGRYELTLTGPGAAASVGFSAGWYAASASADTPDVLDVSLDRATYAAGDTAHARLKARAAGQVLVTVASDRLISMKALAVQAGETVVDLPVTADWGAGAYVTATLVRPMDVAAGRNPARAIGLAWAGIDRRTRTLEARFLNGPTAMPRAEMTARLQVEGVEPGAEIYATLAAVDVGILNLTGFEAPDPSGYYFGQRKLGVEMRDLYGRLIDGMQGAPGKIRSGGDGGAGFRSPPPTEKLVAFFEGPLKVDDQGIAEAKFPMPDFNGTVKLMAVVWNQGGVGEASADVLVRDPVVAQVNSPRFLSPGDKARLEVDLTHVSGPAGPVGLNLIDLVPGIVDVGDPAQAVTLADKGRATARMPLTAVAVGDAGFRLDLTLPGGAVLDKALVLPVRDNDPVIARQTRFELAPGKALTLDASVLDGLRTGGAHVTVAVGPLADFDVPGLLTALDGYPFGCAEQIASQTMALIYFDQLSVDLGLAEKANLRKRIEDGIAAVLANQTGGGGFGLWGPDGSDAWLDGYVTDVLSRARAAGYSVPDRAFQAALLNLSNRVNSYGDFEKGGEDLAYALMVLAREGQASIGDLRYYADTKARDFATPLAKAQLGAALAAYGDPSRADRMFGLASEQGLSGADETVYRADFGSGLRDAAGVLTLAVEARSTAIDEPGLVGKVTAETPVRSTQEQVWTLLAALALMDQAEGGAATLNGAPMTGPAARIDEAALRAGPVQIGNAGQTPTQVVVTAFGIPDQPEPAGGNGYRVERAYYALDGKPVTLDSVPRNTRLVAVLTVTPERDIQARLMVDDPLPAGFEIDNPNLLRGGDLANFAWLNADTVAAHSEFRSDRFRAAVDWSGSEPFQLAYVVRAISWGDFHHPAASVIDMYRPAYGAHSDAGSASVVDPAK